MPEIKNTLYCSFCGKSQHEVAKLIAGPTTFICDECVTLCADILKEDGTRVVSYPPILSRSELHALLGENPILGSELFKRAFGLSLQGTEYENDSARFVLDHLYTTLTEYFIEGWTPEQLDVRIKKIEDDIRLAESAHARLDLNRSLLEQLKIQRAKVRV